MAIIEVETPRGIRHRDTDTGKFASKAAFQSQVQLPAMQQFLPPKSGIGPVGEGDLKSPVSSLREILESISEKMTTLVELTRQSLGSDRDKSLAAADTTPIFPKPSKEDGGGQGAPIEFPEIGPKMGLALMLGGLALLFKFSDKIIPVIAKALEIGKSVYTNTLDFIDATKENLKGAITGPGTVIAGLKIFRVDLVKAIKSSRLFGFIASGFGLLDVASGGPPGATKAGLLTRILRIFKPLTDLTKILAKMPVIKQIGTFFGKAGGFLKLLGKLFLPLTIIIAIFDTIKGALDGYKESDEETWSGKIIDGLAGGITGLVNSLIGIPLDFLKAALAWVLGKMGFDKEAEALKSFSFADIISDIIGGIFGYVKKAIEWVGTLFTDPVEALKELWKGLVGEGGLLDIFYAPVDAAIGWMMGIFGFNKPDTVLTDEGGEFKGLRQLGIDAAKNMFKWFSGLFSFDASKISEGLGDFSGFMKATAFASTAYLTTLLNPFTKGSNIEAAAKAYQESMAASGFDNSGEGGVDSTGSFTPSIEGISNQGQIDIANTADKTLAEVQQEMNLKEGAIPGTTIIDNKTVTGGDTVSADTYNTNDLGVDSTDPTALIGQAPWLTNPAFK